MMTRTGRLALAAAMLSIGFGVSCGAEAGGIALQTPAGLTPGESFRFAFITDGTTAPASTDISYYNNFVTTQAGGATYNGELIPWLAIASTPTVNAIDNVGQTLTPVYLADGTLVTSSTTASGLWSGNLLHLINEDLTGRFPFDLARIWTGTSGEGIGFGLLGTAGPSFGLSAPDDAMLDPPGWVFTAIWGSTVAPPAGNLYGISPVLIVPGAVPEPSSWFMAGTAIVAGSALGWSRRRKEKGRQSPVREPDATE